VVDLAQGADPVRERVPSTHRPQRTLTAVAEEDVPEREAGTPVSGLAIPFRVPPALATLWRRWDTAARAGAEPT
jgi:hypothetical protein